MTDLLLAQCRQQFYFSNDSTASIDLIEQIASTALPAVDEALLVAVIDFATQFNRHAHSQKQRLMPLVVEIVANFVVAQSSLLSSADVALTAQRIDLLDEPRIVFSVVNRLAECGRLKASPLRPFLVASLCSSSAAHLDALDFLQRHSALLRLLASFEPHETQATRIAAVLARTEPSAPLIEQLNKHDPTLLHTRPLFKNDLSLIESTISMIKGEGFWIDTTSSAADRHHQQPHSF
jgi:hypothetical protein